MFRRFTLLSLFCLASALGRSAEPRPLELNADEGTFDGKTNERILRGHAQASDGTTLITADEIRENSAAETITFIGHVIFTRTDIRLLADKLTVQRRTQSFTADRVRFGVHPYYAEGETASGTFQEITLSRAVVTYGEPGPWQPTFKADKIIYAPGQRLRTENAQAGIGHAQPLPFPRFQQNLKEPLVSFASLTGGYRSSLGAFAEAGLHLPTAANVRLGGDLGLYSNRGIMIGPSGNYGGAAGSDLRGYFRTGYINDHGDKKTDVLGRPVPENRGYVEWQHEQKLTDRLSLSAQLNWWKDSEILRDFRPRAFFPVQAPDTFVESAYAGRNYFVSLFARFQPNSFQRVQERLPELRFDLLPTVIGNGFVERFSASAVVLRETQVADGRGFDVVRAALRPNEARSTVGFPVIQQVAAVYSPLQWVPLLPPGPNNPDPASVVTSIGGAFVPVPRRIVFSPAAYRTDRDGPESRSTRFDAYYSLARPFAYREWLSVVPVAGLRFTHYRDMRQSVLTYQDVPATVTQPAEFRVDSALRALPDYTRALGEIGFDAALRTSATWDYKNPLWKIDGLRHLLTPKVSYRYIPQADKGIGRIIPIDRRTFATYLQPLGLGDQRNIDDLSATNTLRLGFDNTLQTRDPVYGSRDLFTFNVANDFRFHPNTVAGQRERTSSEIHTDLAFAPAPWLSVDIYQSFTPQTWSLREFNSGVTLRDGDVWSIRFANNFLRHQIQDYQLDGRVRLNETYEALTRLHYDARRRRFNEQAYGLAQNLGNTWLVTYVVSLYSGPRRESHFGLNIQIEARGF